MKKFLALALAAMLALCAFAGCSGEDAEVVLTTNGSTSMEKLMEIYMDVYTDATITYAATGSGAGITAVTEGNADIGLASRDLKDSEVEAGLTGYVVAIDGIAIVVHPANPVSDLSIEQIAKIYTKEITNWSELGGEDATIVVVGREAGSGTRDGFESVTGTAEACSYDMELNSTGDVRTTVAGNTAAIGYISLSSVSEEVSAVSVEGVLPSEETVQDGSYAVQRNFVMAVKTDSVSDEAMAFINWALSSAADEYVREAGCVPIVH